VAEEPKTLKTEQILSEISRLFMAPAHDRQVYEKSQNTPFCERG
jgi:hypothetical protein